MTLELRILDPVADLELFRESYNWRPEPKRHTQPDRASFEAFTSDDPRQMVIGLFNGGFLAVFLLFEYERKHYETHFTSRRGVSREILIEGGRLIRDACLQNGAEELCAWITKRNSALRGYLEALEFLPQEEKSIKGKTFVRYFVRGR